MKTMRALWLIGLVWLMLPVSGWAFYNAEEGRWLSRDPIGEKESNLYAAVKNAPVIYSDLLGLATYQSTSRKITTPKECRQWCKKRCEGRLFEKFKYDVDGWTEPTSDPRVRRDVTRYTCSCYCPPKCEYRCVGRFAVESVEASGPRVNRSTEGPKIQQLMDKYGCHHCGIWDSNAIGDHQPPVELSEPGTRWKLYPHCHKCASRQGGEVNACKSHKAWFEAQPGRVFPADKVTIGEWFRNL